MVDSYIGGEERLKRIAAEKGKKVANTKDKGSDKGKTKIPGPGAPKPKSKK